MKRAGAALLACAAACSIYDSSDSGDVVVPAGSADAGLDGSPETLDGGDSGAVDLENVIDDASTSDASATDAASDSSLPLPDLYVFVSSKKINGNINFGAPEAAADKICNDLALGRAKLNGRKFMAWISIDTKPEDRILKKAAGHRYLSLDGEVVMNDPTLAPPTILTRILFDDYGIKVSPVDHVWTGIEKNGNASTATCNFWGSASNDSLGLVGALSSNDTWTSFGVDRCDTLNRIYCFEVP